VTDAAGRLIPFESRRCKATSVSSYVTAHHRPTAFAALREYRAGIVMQTALFASTCPRCRAERVQDGFTLSDLRRLLSGGYPIEAHCAACRALWPISPQKRDELARWLLRSHLAG
jgi:hypothetical protein